MQMHIGKPYLRDDGDNVFLCAAIRLDGQEQEAWFSVETEYAQYLTVERSDAFVIAFLTTAMRMKADIFCQVPLTKRLYYQLTTYLIPSMAANMDIYHSIKIHAPLTDEPLPCAGAVGTGWMGGVDSMYTLMNHTQNCQNGYRLTHLLTANNGALESKDGSPMLRKLVQKFREEIGKEQNLSVIGIDSNIQDLQQENYLAVVSFRLCAVVLAVQKLFRVYLHSSDYPFSQFKMDQEDVAKYELLPLSCFETDNTSFYSSGGTISRMQKLEALAEFSPAQKHLHPCIYPLGGNCSACLKCTHTMIGLYSLGKLEKFGSVFDVERFYRQKEDYFYRLLMKSEFPLEADVLRSMRSRGVQIPRESLRRARIRKAAIVVAQRNLKPKEE